MRIISQDGNKDFPYERCTVWILDNKIIASPVGEPETDSRMATYSTMEKAEKAMQKLHECYTGVLLMQNVDFPEGEVENLKSMAKGFICVNNRTDNVRIEPMHMVFRFPQEDEI